MTILKFEIRRYEKYDSATIYIENGILKLDGAEIFEIRDLDNGYQKAVVKLTDEQIYVMGTFEEEPNEYLAEYSYAPIKLVYENKIYPKKNSGRDKITKIKLKRVYATDGQSFPQLWLE